MMTIINMWYIWIFRGPAARHCSTRFTPQQDCMYSADIVAKNVSLGDKNGPWKLGKFHLTHSSINKGPPLHCFMQSRGN